MILFLACTQMCMGKKHLVQLDSVFKVAEEQNKKVWHYKSDFYYKGMLQLTRRNFTYHFCDNRDYYEKNGRILFSERTGTMDHAFRLHFDYCVHYRFDAVPRTNTALDYNSEFFAISIYTRYLLRNSLLSPLNGKNAKYYKYKMKSDTAGIVRFTFKPKVNNSQMVRGTFYYNKKEKYVTEIVFNGDDGVMKFQCHLTMGKDGQTRYWPEKNELTYRYRYYGNLFDGNCTFYQQYTEVDPDYDSPHSKYGKYDMTYLYSIDEDTMQSVVDSMQIARRRVEPLTNVEQQIYDICYAKYRYVEPKQDTQLSTDSLPADVRRKMVTKKFTNALGNAGGIFFHDFDFRLSPTKTMSFNAVRFNYSGWKGFTLTEDAEFSVTPDNGRRLSIKPLVGYNFKPNMLVGSVRSDWDYMPMRRGQISLQVGTRGLKTTLDRLGIYGVIPGGPHDHPYLFRETSVELQHSVELFNGLNLMTGVVYKNRSPFRIEDIVIDFFEIQSHYVSFGPRICVTYTPGQLFYFKNNRKEVIGSQYPTISLDYERAISRLFNASNKYEKWEATVTQNLPLDPIHQLTWVVGGGMFTNRENVRFVDYRFFNDGITDYTWRDEWAGVFQLLDSKYYYDSMHYLRAHLLMQSPSILLGRFGNRFIRAERVYASGLMTEGLAPYIEMGYGVSSELLDVSFFASYINKEPIQTGLKFSIHLQ